jgi:hypothetical protein
MSLTLFFPPMDIHIIASNELQKLCQQGVTLCAAINNCIGLIMFMGLSLVATIFSNNCVCEFCRLLRDIGFIIAGPSLLSNSVEVRAITLTSYCSTNRGQVGFNLVAQSRLETDQSCMPWTSACANFFFVYT